MLRLPHFNAWNRACPRHPRFNPAAGGRAAVRGNCSLCLQLVEIHDAHEVLTRKMRGFTAAKVSQLLKETA